MPQTAPPTACSDTDAAQDGCCLSVGWPQQVPITHRAVAADISSQVAIAEAGRGLLAARKKHDMHWAPVASAYH